MFSAIVAVPEQSHSLSKEESLKELEQNSLEPTISRCEVKENQVERTPFESRFHDPKKSQLQRLVECTVAMEVTRVWARLIILSIITVLITAAAAAAAPTT